MPPYDFFSAAIELSILAVKQMEIGPIAGLSFLRFVSLMQFPEHKIKGPLLWAGHEEENSALPLFLFRGQLPCACSK